MIELKASSIVPRSNASATPYIEKRIGQGQLDFADEFPDYRFKAALPAANYVEVSIKPEI